LFRGLGVVLEAGLSSHDQITKTSNPDVSAEHFIGRKNEQSISLRSVGTLYAKMISLNVNKAQALPMVHETRQVTIQKACAG
jgi:hypothetical protein